MEALLREAYMLDLIDVDTFERFIGDIVAGRLVALPYEVMQLGVRFSSPSTRSFASVLKSVWTESQL